MLPMDVEWFGVLWLAHQLTQIAMGLIGKAAGGSHLDRHVLNAEIRRDCFADRAKEGIRQNLIVTVDKHMACQHDQSWLDGPNMEIVDILHPGDRFDCRCHMSRTDARRSRFQDDLQ